MMMLTRSKLRNLALVELQYQACIEINHVNFHINIITLSILKMHGKADNQLSEYEIGDDCTVQDNKTKI